MKNNIKNELLEIFFIIIYSFILFVATYLIKEDKITSAIYIVIDLLYAGDIIYIVISYLIILSIQFMIKSIVKENWKTNIISTILVLVITIISYYKYNILNLPFVPSDILLIGNIGQIAKFGVKSLPITTILIILILFLILFLHYLINKKNNSLKKNNTLEMYIFRIILFIVGIVILYNLCIVPNRYERLNIKNDMGYNYFWMGANGVFFMHLGDFYSVNPQGYTQQNIENIEKDIKQQNSIDNKSDFSNVIMIMNESFSNPNIIKNVEYSINPLKNIESLAKTDKNCIIGNLITPVYGGGTSLPEFEALTGLSSYFIEKQIFPYTSYITENMNSVARNYKNNGYTTIGIHPNTETFYNRKNVYKYLGFEQTIFKEDMNEPEFKGENVSDNELADQIIEKFQENEGDKYIFGVTMQNHMPYINRNYVSYDIDIAAEGLTDYEKVELKNYVQGIYDGDKMYMKLVNYLKNIDEPTILVMFGDHLPSMSSIYKKSGFVELNYYTTPYIIWANYDIKYDEANIQRYISPSNLSINIMRLANIEIPWYFKKFEELYKNYPAINNQLVITNEGKKININQITNYDLINDCRILQYDLLIKKKYIPVK